MLKDDDALTAGCDVGDGSAWEDRCNAGDDIDAWRIDGVMKLVCPPTRSLPLLDSSYNGAGVEDSRSPLRKVTRRNIFSRSFSLAAPSSRGWVSFSFPFFVFPVIVANSSTGGVGSFFDRVAVLRLCSREERNL